MNLLGDPPTLDGLIAQCLPVHATLIQAVADIAGALPVLTIGCVTDTDGDQWFSVTEEEIRRWRATGAENPHALELHAWLTLPTMEIVDFTFVPTYAKVRRIKLDDIGCIAKHADALTGMTYRPVAMGNDIPDKLGFPYVLIF